MIDRVGNKDGIFWCGDWCKAKCPADRNWQALKDTDRESKGTLHGSSHTRIKNGPSGLSHSQQIYLCLLQKKIRSCASLRTQKIWSTGQKVLDMVRQKHFSAPHFHWCVRWEWGRTELDGERPLWWEGFAGVQKVKSPETHPDCSFFLSGENFCLAFFYQRHPPKKGMREFRNTSRFHWNRNWKRHCLKAKTKWGRIRAKRGCK